MNGAVLSAHAFIVVCLLFSVEKKKETITENAGRQQKKKIGKKPYPKDSLNKLV